MKPLTVQLPPVKLHEVFKHPKTRLGKFVVERSRTMHNTAPPEPTTKVGKLIKLVSDMTDRDVKT